MIKAKKILAQLCMCSVISLSLFSTNAFAINDSPAFKQGVTNVGWQQLGSYFELPGKTITPDEAKVAKELHQILFAVYDSADSSILSKLSNIKGGQGFLDLIKDFTFVTASSLGNENSENTGHFRAILAFIKYESRDGTVIRKAYMDFHSIGGQWVLASIIYDSDFKNTFSTVSTPEDYKDPSDKQFYVDYPKYKFKELVEFDRSLKRIDAYTTMGRSAETHINHILMGVSRGNNKIIEAVKFGNGDFRMNNGASQELINNMKTYIVQGIIGYNEIVIPTVVNENRPGFMYELSNKHLKFRTTKTLCFSI